MFDEAEFERGCRTLERNMHNIGAYLAHPFLDMPSETYNFSPDDIKSIYDFLRENRVILRTMNQCFIGESKCERKKNLLTEIVKSDPLFARARDFAVYQQENCIELVKAMSEKGIDLIFIKSVNEFPLDSHNFDVLIKREDLDAGKQVLEEIGYKEIAQLREPFFKWFYRKVKGNFIVSVHLHVEIAWEVEFVNIEDLWDKHRVRVIENLKVCFPSPEHQLIITAAHAFFENRSLKLSDLVCIIDAIRIGKKIDWNYIADWCIQDDWLKAFYAILKLANHIHESFYGKSLIEEEAFKTLEAKGNLNGFNLDKRLILQFEKAKNLPVKIPNVSAGSIFISKVMKNRQKSLAERINIIAQTGYHFVRLRLPLRRDLRTFLICFIGQDGSGKTAHAQGLQNELTKMLETMNDELAEQNIRIRYVWSRGIGLTIEPFKRMARSLLISGSSIEDTTYTRKRQGLIKKEPIKTLWAYTILVDETLQLLTKVKIPLMLRNVIICDRYIYDVFADIECDLNKNISWTTKKFFRQILPNPEVKLITEADPTEIVKRKEDLELSQVCCKRQNYNVYATSKQFILIDTSKDFQQNKEKVLSSVLWSLMF